MVDKPLSNDPSVSTPSAQPASPLRRSGHRGADMRDTVAELTERAQLISQEAGGRIAAAMKDVISAGAGIAGFALGSARDLVQFMVRRGQMTAEEGDKLMREAEAAHDQRSPSEKARPTASKLAADRAAAAKAEAAARAAAAAAALPPHRAFARPVVPPATSTAPAPATPTPKTAKAKTSDATPDRGAASKNGKKTAAKTAGKSASQSRTKSSGAATPKPPSKTAKPAKKKK